jgi:ferric-dicitrate binding protein FerR (iron transport regulator)
LNRFELRRSYGFRFLFVISLCLSATASLSLSAAAQALSSVGGSLRAQDTGQPARAVHLSYVDGKVQLARGEQIVANQAVIDTPLLQGMTLTTADDGRAEIQFEDGSVARLTPNTTLTLKTLSGAGASAVAEMELSRGLAYFESQGNGQVAQMSVRFDEFVVTASGFTVFRIENHTPPGSVAAFSGNAHLEPVRAGELAIDLYAGESVVLGTSDPNDNLLRESIEHDSWDAWNSDRDRLSPPKLPLNPTHPPT